MAVEVLSTQRCFGGVQGFYRHPSSSCGVPMRFGVYSPPQAEHGTVPVVYFLAGLTCTEETFAIKAGAQRMAAELGLMLVTPDTSPRDTGIAGEAEDWEFGSGAGFYVDATQQPWAQHFKMASYITQELPSVIASSFAIDRDRSGICGHSMGGHGALTIALRHPDQYRSVSAFAPIVAPTHVPWGTKALPRFLSEDLQAWNAYDACALVESGQHFAGTILIDQGMSDKFLESQLRPELFEAVCARHGQALELRRQVGYDHSYYFIQSFIEDHLRHHAEALT